MMAWQYGVTCFFDFILAPILVMYLNIKYKVGLDPWMPSTLREGGFYHLAMGGIVGITSWTRGNEKIEQLRNDLGVNKTEQ